MTNTIENKTALAPTVVKNQNDLKQFIYHPTTILLMMAMDWGGFLLEIPQTLAPFLLVFSAIGIFLFTSVITYNLQKNFGGDSPNDARNKAILAGFICALPFPVMSTIIGATILSMSGFNSISELGTKGVVEMFKKREG